MRKGYWRILIRRLRGKVAGGDDTFMHRDGVFSISTLLATDDVDLEQDGDLRLADDDQGNLLVLEVSSARVFIVYGNNERVLASEDLASFVDALRTLVTPRLELGPVMEDPIDLPSSRRGVLDEF